MMRDFAGLKESALTAWRAQASWREQAEDDFAFVAGHQWSREEIAQMEENQRVPLVFNRVAVIMSAVAGSEVNNRTEVRFIPRELGDAKPNEVLTAGAEWFRDAAMAEDEESEAFSDLITCGMGWTETSLDFEEDDEGEPEIERIPPTEMFWEVHARRKGLTDARMVGRVRQMPTDEALERFEGKDREEIDARWIDGQSDMTETHNVPGDEYRDGEDMDDRHRNTVTVVQMQYRAREKVVEYLTPDGDRKEMPADQWSKIMARMPEPPPHRRKSKWVWRQVFLGANDILDENQPDPAACTFTCMTGRWDDREKCFYGLLRPMRDPQKYANKWMSQTLHIINANAKGGVMLEADAVEDAREFEDSWAATDAVTWLKSGAIANGRIQPKPTAQMPQSLMSLTEFAVSTIRDASGVNLEILGQRDANQPGVLEYQRRESAMTTLAQFFDALRYYRKRQGGVILDFLRNYIAPMGRLVRIVKEGQEQYVPLAVDEGVRKYDVIVDDAPSAPNQKEKAWSVIEAMMPLLQNAGLSMSDWADILEYSPLPPSFVEKVRAKAEQAQNPEAEQMAQQAQQLALQQAQAELQKTQTEAMENQANAALDMAKAQDLGSSAQLAPMKMQADAALTAAKAREANIGAELAPMKAFADVYQPMSPPAGRGPAS